MLQWGCVKNAVTLFLKRFQTVAVNTMTLFEITFRKPNKKKKYMPRNHNPVKFLCSFYKLITNMVITGYMLA